MRAPEFWRQGGALGTLLAPLGWCYGAGTRARFAFARPYRAAVPVVCVGNVVAGGAGKTPVAISIGKRLMDRGRTVHFLGRGYGGRGSGPVAVDPGAHGARETGDEALLLAGTAPTWVTPDRIAGTRAAAGADVIVMDDGYQDPSVMKDVGLLVVDGRFGFGNGHMIPAGPLRETPSRALSRAAAVVVLGPDDAGVGDHPDVRRAGMPVLKAGIVPGPEAQHLRGKTVVAFAGIGDPAKFFATVESLGARIAAAVPFADHHPFTSGDLRRLRAEAARHGAILVTTEKDAVRLSAAERDGIAVLAVSLQWDDEGALDAVLAPVMAD